MRCFIAIDLPENIKKELYNRALELYNLGLFKGKITEKGNLHLTLKFLGEISEKKIEEVKKKLREVKEKKFKAKLAEFGVFSEKSVRIIWVHLSGAENLQKEIDEKLEGLFKKDKRFVGHITIARVKSCEKKNLIDKIKKINLKEEFFVENFKLLCSELTSSGPIYSTLENFELE